MRLPQDRILHIDTELAGDEVRVVAEWQGEIVRCKDCKYRDTNYGQAENDECRWLADERPDDDDYCSFGERRD